VKLLGISPEARDLLLKYEYSGNVRELENIIERAVENKNEVKTFRTLRDMVLILTRSLF